MPDRPVQADKFNESLRALVISQLVTVNSLYHVLDSERTRLMQMAKKIGVSDKVILDLIGDN